MLLKSGAFEIDQFGTYNWLEVRPSVVHHPEFKDGREFIKTLRFETVHTLNLKRERLQQNIRNLTPFQWGLLVGISDQIWELEG